MSSGYISNLIGNLVVDVVDIEQAILAEVAGASAVKVIVESTLSLNAMHGPSFEGSSYTSYRESTLKFIEKLKDELAIPIIAPCPKGHFVLAQILEALGVDFIDECEELKAADEDYFINKHKFKTPFIAAASGLSDALWRIAEGAAIIRTPKKILQELAETSKLSDTVRIVRQIQQDIRVLGERNSDELPKAAQTMPAPYHFILQVAKTKKLPVPFLGDLSEPNPFDAALLLQLGVDGLFVGNAIFKTHNPASQIKLLIQAVQHCREPELLLKESFDALDPVV